MLAPEVRFWKHVVKTNDCWLWNGAIRSDYGSFGVGGKTVIASRFSYELHKGPIPEKMLVCHTCDTPTCVNPDHLWLGTHKQNSDDMIAKGRARRGRTRKLTPAQVQEILRLDKPKTLSQSELGNMFGVTKATISIIVNQKRGYKTVV